MWISRSCHEPDVVGILWRDSRPAERWRRIRQVSGTTTMILQSRAAIAFIAAVLALVFAIALLPRNPPILPATEETIPPSASWPSDYVVAPGDRVVGKGQLVDSSEGPVRLCTGQDAIISTTYHCTSLSVIVDGVDVGSLDGVRRSDGATYAYAVVRGVWTGESLRVDQVGGRVLRVPVARELDCEFTVPGATDDANAGQQEDPYQHLQSIVDGNPDKYAGIWRSPGGGRMLVVATTQDLAPAGLWLRQNFAYPLCLVRVPYSMADLTDVAARLRLPSGIAWRPEIDVRTNRVLVRVPVLDVSVDQAVASIPEVELVPLVFKERQE